MTEEFGKYDKELKEIQSLSYNIKKLEYSFPTKTHEEQLKIAEYIKMTSEQEEKYIEKLNVTSEKALQLLNRYIYLLNDVDYPILEKNMLIVRFQNILNEKTFITPFHEDETRDSGTMRTISEQNLVRTTNLREIEIQAENDIKENNAMALVEQLSLDLDPSLKYYLYQSLIQLIFTDRTKLPYLIGGKHKYIPGKEKCKQFNHNDKDIDTIYWKTCSQTIEENMTKALQMTDEKLNSHYLYRGELLLSLNNIKSCFKILSSEELDIISKNIMNELLHNDKNEQIRENSSQVIETLKVMIENEYEERKQAKSSTKEKTPIKNEVVPIEVKTYSGFTQVYNSNLNEIDEYISKQQEISYNIQNAMMTIPYQNEEREQTLNYIVAGEKLETELLSKMNITETNFELVLQRYKYVLYKSDFDYDETALLFQRFQNIVEDKILSVPLHEKTKIKNLDKADVKKEKLLANKRNRERIKYQLRNELQDISLTKLKEQINTCEDPNLLSSLYETYLYTIFTDRKKLSYLQTDKEKNEQQQKDIKDDKKYKKPKLSGKEICLLFNQEEEIVNDVYKTELNKNIKVNITNALLLTNNILESDPNNSITLQLFKNCLESNFKLQTDTEFNGSYTRYRNHLENKCNKSQLEKSSTMVNEISTIFSNEQNNRQKILKLN